MPDKHEVGGSSPLGPTSCLEATNPIKTFSSGARDKLIQSVVNSFNALRIMREENTETHEARDKLLAGVAKPVGLASVH